MQNKSLLLFIISSISINVNANNDIHLFKKDEELKWNDMPHSAGKYTVLAGDPTKEDIFVIRVKFPPNYSIVVHRHNHYEYDTVISGSCYIAKGNIFKKENGLLATAGTFVAIPPHLAHYGWTGPKGAIIQLSGIGPWNPIYK